MKAKLFNILFSFLVIAIFVLSAQAQDLKECAYVDNIPGNEPLPDNIRERMITLCIEESKKEFEELIKRSEEVAKLSKEIEESYIEKNELSKEDQQKLKEVEDLVSKIRKELRADDDDDDDEVEAPPTSTMEALKNLQENTTKLFEEIKKTTRHTVSAAAIESSNAVKKLLKFLRFGK